MLERQKVPLLSPPLLTRGEEIELGKIVEESQKAEKKLRKKFPYWTCADKEIPCETLTCKEANLLRAVEAGNKARHKFVLSNLRLVVNISKGLAPESSSFSLQDFISEGILGLMEAIERWDWRYGTRFSTYSTFWIRRAIINAQIQRGNLIRLPANQVQAVVDYGKLETTLTHKLHRPPCEEEIAEEMGWDIGKAHMLRKIKNRTLFVVSLDALIPDGRGGFLRHVVDDKNGQQTYGEDNNRSAGKAIAEALKRLRSKERDVICMRFGLVGNNGKQLTLKEVGKKLGITGERVRQIAKRALKKLRTYEDLAELASGQQ